MQFYVKYDIIVKLEKMRKAFYMIFRIDFFAFKNSNKKKEEKIKRNEENGY